MSEQATFLYRLKLTPKYQDQNSWDEKAEQVIRAHVNFLNDLGKKGILIFAGRTSYEPGDQNLFGVALIKANSLEHAKAVMADDPTVVNQVHHSEVFPFSVAIDYFKNLS